MTTRRDYILASIAMAGQAGVLGAVVVSWVNPPQNPEIVIGALSFCQNLVLSIVGYFAGASRPDSEKQ